MEEIARQLAKKAGINGQLFLEPVNDGFNNRGFRLYNDISSYFLKSYFKHENDLRDRLGTEFAFSTFAWNHGVRMIPMPILCDREHSIGIYEFVQGRKIVPHEINDTYISQVLKFYTQINHNKQSRPAKDLAISSEACFSIHEHLRCIEKRVQRLVKIDNMETIDRDAQDFIKNKISPTWELIYQTTIDQSTKWNVDIYQTINEYDQIISPSDFGFHNTLLEKNGKLRFIDFEYAGWDDPAKLVCDFFCQLAIPVPLRYLPMFIEQISINSKIPNLMEKRIKLLLPVYRVKWCCIILNDFLDVHSQRRHFASNKTSIQRKSKQLEKAKVYFSQFL